jgi:hypothetical protein
VWLKDGNSQGTSSRVKYPVEMQQANGALVKIEGGITHIGLLVRSERGLSIMDE